LRNHPEWPREMQLIRNCERNGTASIDVDGLLERMKTLEMGLCRLVRPVGSN
jgi:hypothetical protein